jgi:hypothetical protein
VRNIFLKPLHSLFILFIFFSVACFSFLSWKMISSDNKESRFEDLKQIKKELNRVISPKENNYFDRLILKDKTDIFVGKINFIEEEVDKLPVSSFEGKRGVLKSLKSLKKDIKKNEMISKDLNKFDKNLVSFYKLVRSNKWKNLLKITNGAIDRLKKAKNTSKLIDVKKSIETLKKDLNLIYRVAEVSTLSQSKKGIVKNRVDDLRGNLSSAMLILDNKIKLLKNTENFLQEVANLTKKVSVIKNNGVLAMHERAFVIKNMLWVYFSLMSVFMFLMIFLMKREEKKEDKLFQEKFWHIIKNYILSTQNNVADKSIEGPFLSEIIDCRSFLKKKELYGNLLKETITDGVLIFDRANDLVWSNNTFSDIFSDVEFKSFKDFSDFFAIGDLVNLSDGLNVSIEKESKWYSINVTKIDYDNEKLIVTYIKRVDEMKSKTSAVFDEKMTKVENCLDEVLNKNDQIAFDKFVQQSEDVFDRIVAKSSRVNKIFKSFESSYLKQIKDLDDVSMDNIKVINDIKKILDQIESEDVVEDEIKRTFITFSTEVTKIRQDRDSLNDFYFNLINTFKDNIEKVESAIENLLVLKKSSDHTNNDLSIIIEKLASIEILDENKPTSIASEDFNEIEEQLAEMLGDYFKKLERIENSIQAVRKILPNDYSSDSISRSLELSDVDSDEEINLS